MLRLPALATAGLLAPSLLGPQRAELAFHPEEGLARTLTFVTTGSAELASVTLSMDGGDPQEPDIDEAPVRSHVETIVVRDVYEGSEGGRPTGLERTFEELSVSREITPPGGDTQEFDMISDLAETTVRFRWDEEEEAFVAEAVDEEVDEELLAGLDEDMSLRGFLPDEEVEEGDSWEVDAAAYGRLMWPGGELGFYDVDGERSEEREDLGLQLRDSLEAEISATLASIEDRDGTRVAVIELEIEAEASGSMERELENATENHTVILERELEGTLVWDLEAGVLVSLDLEGDAHEINRMEAEFEQGGESHTFEQEGVYEGTVSYSVNAD